MRKLINRHFLFFISLTLLASGCGNQSGRTPEATFSATTQMESVANLTTEERAIATRICYAYQSKGTNFRTSVYLGKTFFFNVDSKKCGQSRSTYSASGTLALSGSGLVYQPTSSNEFETQVQTMDSGFLATLCTKIQNNEVISNTTTSGTSKIQVHFFRDTLDSYTLKYFSLYQGKMLISGADSFKVRTQNSIQQSSQILGMDESYSSYETCSLGGDTYSEFYQNFNRVQN